ncbi:hypothetical protein [Roseibium sp.]|uniref:hypothetical protein n=1 Tax=Roseibium sp. TaxID=1936156 RepID=UPI003BAFECA2
MFRSIVCYAMVLWLFSALSAPAFGRSLFNAWEVGSLDQIDAYTATMLSDLKKFEQAWRITLHHRKMKANHDHFDQTKLAVCRLSFRWINTQRAMLEARKRQKTVYRLTVPPSVDGLREATKKAFDLANEYVDRPKDCKALTIQDYQRFVEATRNLREIRNRLGKISKRQRKTAWSTTLSVELSPLPLKLEVVEGSIKLKFTKNIGPLKFDLQTGPKLQRYSSSSGLKYLVVRTPDKRARVFFVAGMNLEFALPASVVNVSGETLTITCSQACLSELNRSI